MYVHLRTLTIWISSPLSCVATLLRQLSTVILMHRRSFTMSLLHHCQDNFLFHPIVTSQKVIKEVPSNLVIQPIHSKVSGYHPIHIYIQVSKDIFWLKDPNFLYILFYMYFKKKKLLQFITLCNIRIIIFSDHISKIASPNAFLFGWKH